MPGERKSLDLHPAYVLTSLPSRAVIDALRGIYRVRSRAENTMFAFISDRAERWVLAWIPLDALDFQNHDESSPTRRALAWKYAEQKGPFPPGVATYGGLAARRRAGKAYVTDGNHRTLAADYRGDVAIRMFMPQDEYETFVNDARFRELVS